MKHALPFCLLILCGLLSFSACKSSKNGSNDAAWSLNYSKGACFGRCPVYKLGADEAGNVQYDGLRFVPITGKDSAKLSKDELKTYRQLVKKAKVAGQPGFVDTLLMDVPYTTFRYQDGGTEKEIRYNREIPAEMKEIIKFLSDFANRKGWLEDPQRVMNATSLEVQLKGATTREQFVQKFVMFKVEVIDELKTQPARYVITWDKERIPAGELLNVFRLSDEVEIALVHSSGEKK